MKDIDEAIQYCEDVAQQQDMLKGRYDDASGYTRSGNEAIRTSDAKKCEKRAADYRQLAEWLRELKAYKVKERAEKTGRWIDLRDDDSTEACKCSECEWTGHLYEDDVYGMLYCPNCGARMANGKEFELPEAEAYPISENIIKGFKEFTELMFERGQEEREEG